MSWATRDGIEGRNPVTDRAAPGTGTAVLESDSPAARAWRLDRWTVGLLCAALVAVDQFVMISLQGAVGSTERLMTDPGTRWLRDSIILAPCYLLAIWAALRLTARWAGRRREIVRISSALVLIGLFTTAVAAAAAAVVAIWDYQLQLGHIEQIHGNHIVIGACRGLCAVKADTIATHTMGIRVALTIVVIANAVLTTWILALRGGSMWVPRPSTRPRTRLVAS